MIAKLNNFSSILENWGSNIVIVVISSNIVIMIWVYDC